MKKYFALLSVLALSFSTLADKPIDYMVMSRTHKGYFYQGKIYRGEIYSVADHRNQRNFSTVVLYDGNVWVGAKVIERKHMGNPDHKVGQFHDRVTDTESQNILMAIDADNKLRNQKIQVARESSDPSGELTPGRRNSPGEAGKAPARYGSQGFPAAIHYTYGPSTQDYIRNRYYHNFSQSYAEQVSRNQWNADQHYRQQQALREAQRAERDGVKLQLQSTLQAYQDVNAFQRAEMLYVFHLGEMAAQAGVENPFEGESQLHSIELTEAGVESLLKEMEKDHSGDWEKKAELAAMLTNPWTGIPGSDRSKNFADGQGVLKGPAFEADSLKIRDLAKKDPAMAYELTRTANSLQAFAADQSMIFRGAKNRSVLESAVTMLRLAAETGIKSHLDQAKAVANFFTGMAMDVKMKVIEENGVKKFAPGGSLTETIREPGGDQKVAQAVHNELTSNLVWMNGADSSTVTQREWGKAYSVEAAMANYLKPGMKNPQAWMNGARQNYPLSAAPNLTFKSPDVQAAYGSVAAQRSSSMALGETARQGAIKAFQIADDIIKFGDSETGQQWIKHGRMMADVGLGFVPGVGLGLDVYSLATGTNLITGEKLSVNERLFSAVSLITLGYGNRIYGGYKAMRGLKAAAEAGHFMPTLNKAIHKVERVPTDKLNARLRLERGYDQDAWKIGAYAYKFELPEKSVGQFVRVFSDDRFRTGSWIVEKRLIEGKTGQEISRILRLDNVPTHVTDVTLEAGQAVIRGKLNFRATFNEAPDIVSGIAGGRRMDIKPQPRVQYFLEKWTDDMFSKEVRKLP